MARFNTFEEIPIWQEARKLVVKIYGTTANEKFKRDFGLKDQIQRAAVSIMANIAEGFEMNSNKEFSRFLGYSKASCGELRSHLYVAIDLGYLHYDKFEELKEISINLSQHIAGFIKYLKNL